MTHLNRISDIFIIDEVLEGQLNINESNKGIGDKSDNVLDDQVWKYYYVNTGEKKFQLLDLDVEYYLIHIK